jgi:hypothetical protein
MAKAELAHLLAQLLTKTEFQAVVATTWIGAAYGAFGFDQLADMERDVISSSLANEMLWGMRALSASGYNFHNFETDGNGVPKPKDNPEPCEGNVAYVLALASGIRFDYLKAVDALIELVNGYGLNLDRHALKQARHEIIETLEATKRDMDQGTAKRIVREKRKRLAAGAAIAESMKVIN